MPAALLEVDFQGWILDMAHDPDVVSRAHATRAAARAAGEQVFCLRYLAHEGPHADAGAPEVRFVDGLAPAPGDLVLSKWTRDAFDNPDLTENLRLRGIDRVTLTGLLSDHGVRLAALSAQRQGFVVAAAGQACAGTSAAAHRQALADLARAGVRVV